MTHGEAGMDDLITWLPVQFDDDERVARAATRGPWRVDDEQYAETIYNVDDDAVVAGGRWNGEASVFDTTADAVHIAHWNPARVLAEVDAKRRILDWCVAAHDRMTAPAPLVAMNVLAALALPYADRPGYRDEWRP